MLPHPLNIISWMPHCCQKNDTPGDIKKSDKGTKCTSWVTTLNKNFRNKTNKCEQKWMVLDEIVGKEKI